MNAPITDIPVTTVDATPRLSMIEAHEQKAEAGMLPGRKRDLWLIAILAAIMAGAVLYNFVIATPRYVSEMAFVLRTPAGSKERLTFLNFGGGGTGSDDSHAIVEYIQSRDLVDEINKDGMLERVFAAPGIDMFSAFPSWLAGDSQDDFDEHVQSYLEAEYDTETAITHVSAQAFTPGDANAIAQRIKDAAEAKVNSLNSRARGALVETAEAESEAAQVELASLYRRMTEAQQRYGVIDPKLEAGAAIEVNSATASELDRINVELASALRAAPNSPQVAQLRNRRAALEAGLRAQRRRTAGGDGSLVQRLQPYLQLVAQRDVAEQRLLASTLVLASLRNSAEEEQIFIEWIAQPSTPDEPLMPEGWWNVLLTLLLASGILFIVRSLSELVMADD